MNPKIKRQIRKTGYIYGGVEVRWAREQSCTKKYSGAFCPNSNFPGRVMAMVFTGLESWRQGWGGRTQNNQKSAKVRTGKTFL